MPNRLKKVIPAGCAIPFDGDSEELIQNAYDAVKEMVDERFPDMSPHGFDYRSVFERQYDCKVVHDGSDRTTYAVFKSPEEVTAFILRWAKKNRKLSEAELNEAFLNAVRS